MIHIQKSHEILRADTGYAHDHARGVEGSRTCRRIGFGHSFFQTPGIISGSKTNIPTVHNHPHFSWKRTRLEGERLRAGAGIGLVSVKLQTALENFSEMESIYGIGDGHGKSPGTSEQGPEKEFPVMRSLPIPYAQGPYGFKDGPGVAEMESDMTRVEVKRPLFQRFVIL